MMFSTWRPQNASEYPQFGWVIQQTRDVLPLDDVCPSEMLPFEGLLRRLKATDRDNMAPSGRQIVLPDRLHDMKSVQS